MTNSPLRDTALFYIQELRNDGAKRVDVVKTLVSELSISSANAAYYVDRVAPKATKGLDDLVIDALNEAAVAAVA